MDNLEKLRELFLIEEKDAIKCSEIVKNSNKYKLEIAGSANKDIFIESLKIREYIKINDISQVEFKNIHFKSNKNIMLFVLYLFSTNNEEHNFANFSNNEEHNFNENLTLNIDTCIVFDNCKFEFHKEDIIFQNIIFSEKVIFENCRFFKHLKFSNIDFKKELVVNKCNCIGIEFSNVEFNDFPNLQINDNNKKNILFKNLSLKMQVNLYKSKFQNINTIEFEDVVFDNVVNFVDSKIHSICTYNFSFKNVEFMKNVSFANIKDSYNIKFFEVKFYSDVEFDINLKQTHKGEDRDSYVSIIKLSDFTIYGKLKFKDIKFNHLLVCFHNLTFETELSLQDILLVDNDTYDDIIYIQGCKFNGVTSFSNSIFQNIIVINNCEFNKRISMFNNEYRKEFLFEGNIVNENAVFMKSTFYSVTSFSSSVFEKAVSFNVVEFMKIPNLYQTIIGSSVSFNITGVKVQDYIFDDIEQECLSYDNSPIITIINGFRHFLRLFKDTLIKTNNLLDANKYKILELYVKEIELSYRLENYNEEVEKIKNKNKIQENVKKLTIKERFDRWFLKLNRATSDHHTDFLKILLFTLSIIGTFFLISIMLDVPSCIKSILDIKDITYTKLYFFIYAILGALTILFVNIRVVCMLIELFKKYNSILLAFAFIYIVVNLYVKHYLKNIIKLFYYFSYLACILVTIYYIATINDDSFNFISLLLLILFLLFLFGFLYLQDTILSDIVNVFAIFGVIGILCSPSIITPFLGAFSEDARNHYLYKAIDKLDDKKALELARIILPNDKDLKEFEPSKTILSKNTKLEQISIFDKTDLSVNFIYEQSNQDKNEQSIYKAKKTLKDYKDELKSSDLLEKTPELKRAVAIDGGVSRLNIAYYLVLAFCIFALQKTMRKNSIIPS